MSNEPLKNTKKEAGPAFTFFYATSAYGPAAIMAAVAATFISPFMTDTMLLPVYFQPVGRDQRSHDGSHCRPDQYKMGALPSMADPGSRAPDHFFHTDVDQSESAHHGKGGILFGRIYGLRNDQNHVYYAPCGAPACLCEK